MQTSLRLIKSRSMLKTDLDFRVVLEEKTQTKMNKYFSQYLPTVKTISDIGEMSECINTVSTWIQNLA